MTDKVLLCAIAKQENKYIREWVDYHLNLGFDHITIYDNNDTGGERISDVLSNDMRVDIVDFRGKKQKSCETQVEAYNHCYKNAKNYTWVLFIDIDEFLWFRDYDNIKVFLAQNWVRKANVIRFHWKCYSDNDQLHYEDRPVMERFTQPCSNVEVNYHTKQMYRTNLGTLRIVNVHYSTNVAYIFYPDGKPAPYTTSTKDSSIHDELAHVKHYVTKSLEEYVRIKWARRCEGSSKTRLSMDFYFKYNKRTDEKVRYYRQLMNELKNAKASTTMIKKSANTNETIGAMAFCPGANTRPVKPVTESAKIAPNSAYNPKDDKVYPFGVSVCISAWKTAEYIEECLDSVAAQTWFKDHDNYEILLGIDGCEETLAKVKEIMHKYKNIKVMMMDKNVGTYVTCNTIMKEARYEWLLRFDSDDTMPNDMVAKIFANDLKNIDLVRYQYHNFGIRQGNGGLANGSHLVKNKVFNHFGGYRNWKISADYDFIYRICNKIHYLELRNIYYNRRTHNNSLMNTNGYEMGSKLRNELNDFVEKKSRQNSIIECEITNFTEIYNNIPKIIVSFTTWLKRQESAAKMLEHFKKQTLKPDKIYCYLSSDEYNGENIPYCLQKFIDEKYLVIKWVKENTYCHKRHEIFKEHFYDYVFIIDDDILYDNNYIMDMFNAAVNHPQNVICYTGCRYEYNEKRMNMTVTENPSVKNSFLGGICCFPPTMFPLDDYFNNIDIRNEIAKKCDSSYIHVILLKNNISVFEVNDRKNKWFTTIDGTQDVGVWQENKKIVRDNINYMENIVRLLVKKFNISDKFNKIYPNFR